MEDQLLHDDEGYSIDDDDIKKYEFEKQQLLLLPNFKVASSYDKNIASYDDFDNTSFSSCSFDDDEGEINNKYDDYDNVGIKIYELEKQQLLMLPNFKKILINNKLDNNENHSSFDDFHTASSSSCSFDDGEGEYNKKYDDDDNAGIKMYELEKQQLLMLPNFKQILIANKLNNNENISSYDDFDNTSFSSCSFDDDEGGNNNYYGDDNAGIRIYELEKQDLLMLPNFKKLIANKLHNNENIFSYDDFDNTSFSSCSFDDDEEGNNNKYDHDDNTGIKIYELEKQELLMLPNFKKMGITNKLNDNENVSSDNFFDNTSFLSCTIDDDEEENTSFSSCSFDDEEGENNAKPIGNINMLTDSNLFLEEEKGKKNVCDHDINIKQNKELLPSSLLKKLQELPQKRISLLPDLQRRSQRMNSDMTRKRFC